MAKVRVRRSLFPHTAAGALATLLGCGGDDSSATEGGSSSDTSGPSTSGPSTSGPSTSGSSSGETLTTTTEADSSSGAVDSSGTTDTTGDPTSTGGSSESSSTGGMGVDELDEDAIARIHDAVEETLGTGYATGCSIAIWRDGAVIYAEGFGTKDEAENPVTPDTLFQIGSDTKKMTAIALLQQVDAGTVELDTTVPDIMPTLDLAASPGALDTLSIDLLLSHRSGLYDYTPWGDAPDDDELLGRVTGIFAANEYAMMPPGIGFNYSNPNFALAGALIETITARPWADVVIEDVAAPLGMAHTYARRDDMLAVETDIASGFGPIYTSDFDTFDLIESLSVGVLGVDWTTPEDHPDNAFVRPAGLVWSTATDMAILAGFLIDGDDTVLSDALREQMQTGQVAAWPGLDPAATGYGYGLGTTRGFEGPQGFRDVPVVEHGGNTLDMTSTFRVLPEQGVAVSILSNGYGDDMLLVSAVALEEAAAGRLPEPSDPPPFAEPAPDDLSEYAGSFADTALGEATITWTGADLEIEVPLLAGLGAPPEPVLTPVYQDIFVMTVAGSPFVLAFYPDLDATPHVYAVNRAFVFARDLMLAPRGPMLRTPGVEPMTFEPSRPLAEPRWRELP